MLRSAALIVVLSVLAAGCTDNPASPTVSPAFSQSDLKLGTGAEAANGGAMTVNYTGWLYDPSKPDDKGLVFDTSTGTTPFTFTLGAGQVIKGWEIGVPGMREGGVRQLIIPPSLGYGQSRSGPIPPNSTLLFEITLVSAVYSS